jgi:hypothetical protein
MLESTTATGLEWALARPMTHILILLAAVTLASVGWADDNQLKNGNFERRQGQVPLYWLPFSDDQNRWHGSFSKEDASQGSSSVIFLNTEKQMKFQGLYQSLRVRPGQRFSFTIFIANDPDHPLSGGSRGQLSIEWYDAQDKEISPRDWSQGWGMHSSKEKWVQYAILGEAPPKAARGNFVITIFSERETTGGFLVDDAVVTKVK